MSDTEVYRILFKGKNKPADSEWIKFRARNREDGFYARLESARNAVKQLVRHVSDVKIQKLGVRTGSQFIDGRETITMAKVDWVDLEWYGNE